MSEPNDKPRPAEAPPAPGPTTSTHIAADVAALFTNGAAAVDDAPTIISKAAIRSQRPEDAFAQTLRGRRLAHFDLVEPIGVGGMAAVIRAQDTQLDRPVALKILPPDMASDPENIRRFQQEARAAAKLDHENIARVYFCGDDQGLHFIAFEFVEGENLRLILERRGRLPVPEAVHYMLQIASGLTHAAERGVVHRDIKPSNIIVGPTGRAKLVDMGLARSLQPVGVGDIELTQSGVTLGTFDYISPEQALEPRSADGRSDIYSMGCTFYQALTGQPPVPEGTAAKKLHHHQHIPPLDPRQLNSSIPDELAAILGRMMAKEPADRYQRPEHLVQHLLQLAQKLGPGGDTGVNGVIYVDAALPNPPRMRPMLVAAIAGSLLVAVVVLHGMSSWPPPRTPNKVAYQPKDQKAPLPPPVADGGKAATAEVTPTPVVNPPATRTEHNVGTVQELAEALASRSGDLLVTLRDDLDLTPPRGTEGGGRAPEIVFAGGGQRELTIQPKQAGKRITLRLTYNAEPDKSAQVEGMDARLPLTFDGGRVIIRNVRFEIDGRAAPQLVIAPLRVRRGGSLTLENCEFVQKQPPGAGRQSDIYVEGAVAKGETAPTITVRECSFVSDMRARTTTSEAVTFAGAGRVNLTNCAFGPHAALVHLRTEKSSGSGGAEVHLTNCSALLVEGTVFQIDDVAARLVVHHSLFSRPVSPDEPGFSGGVLIRQDGNATVETYQGNGNRYHNLAAMWARTQDLPPIAEDWDRFRIQVNDAGSEPLDVSPWTEKDPLRALDSGELARAFHADTRNRQLRQAGGDKMIGVEVCTWVTGPGGNRHVYGAAPLPAVDERRELVVDPSASGSTDGKYFSTLEKAVLEARPGETILIRKNGELSVEQPIRLDKPAVDLVIRPYRGYHPVLALGEVTDKDVALFRVQDGKLLLEDLEIRLKPRQRDARDEAQAVVAMGGHGHCSFKRCIFTFGGSDGGEGGSFAVVALADPSNVMKMGPAAPRPMPLLVFENCFARGRGSLVNVRASRPFELRADHCVVALTGPFCNIEASTAKEVPMTPAQITLAHVTAALPSNLLQLHTTKDTKDLVPLNVKASECVFAASLNQPLVHIDGEVSKVTLKRALTWDGRRNVYLNFKQFLDQAKGEDNMLSAFNRDLWLDFTKETNALFEGSVRWVAPPPNGERSLLDAVPGQFRIRAEDDTELPALLGADLSRLPSPQAKVRVGPVAPEGE
ncbi:hypothetical protein AYO40_00905 [Planctomycetaceae bacterium SCGC AG-212-D15]|nr:hypothetical protein AYO40_00905 [Planctomycetaceae bacterium SCGC AG-212-D15]